MPSRWTAIVLAGGRSSRLGHDKAQALLDERRLVDHVLSAVPHDVDVIVVGPDPQASGRAYAVTREPDPGTGPVAGIAAGLALVRTPIVAVVAVDMPFAAPLLTMLVAELEGASAQTGAVIPVDSTGREQPLAAAYRVEALRSALASLGAPENRSMRDLRAGLIVELHAHASEAALLDVDTAEDLEAARRSVQHHGDGGSHETEGGSMDEWVAAVSQALGIDQAVDVDTVLDVARDAAHAVARPAAPVTTFLLGVAVANGASPTDAAAKIAELAQGWPTDQ